MMSHTNVLGLCSCCDYHLLTVGSFMPRDMNNEFTCCRPVLRRSMPWRPPTWQTLRACWLQPTQVRLLDTLSSEE